MNRPQQQTSKENRAALQINSILSDLVSNLYSNNNKGCSNFHHRRILLQQVCSIWVPIWLQLDAEIVKVTMIVNYSQLERMTAPNLDLTNNNSYSMVVDLSEKASAKVTHSLSCTSTRIKTNCICKITIQVANTSIQS